MYTKLSDTFDNGIVTKLIVRKSGPGNIGDESGKEYSIDDQTGDGIHLLYLPKVAAMEIVNAIADILNIEVDFQD
jgi:hypothetical protein